MCRSLPFLTAILATIVSCFLLTACGGGSAPKSEASSSNQAPPKTLVELADDIWKTVEKEADGVAKNQTLQLKIFYPSETIAKKAITGLQVAGFATTLQPSQNDGRTAVIARTKLKPSFAELEVLLGIVNAQIEALEGEYDSYVIATGGVEGGPN